MKLIYLDVETTGLSPWKCAITELAYIIEKDEEVIEKDVILAGPSPGDLVDDKALEVQGVTIDELEARNNKQGGLLSDFMTVLARHINKYDKKDKFTTIAYNGHFDMEFLRALFKKAGDTWFGSWFNHKLIDPIVIIRAYEALGAFDPPLKNNKLGTVCERFGIEFEAHKALSDIEATRELWIKLSNLMSHGWRKES